MKTHVDTPKTRLASSWHTTSARLQPKVKVGAPNDRFEHEADRVADAIVAMRPPSAISSRTAPRLSLSPSIQRAPDTKNAQQSPSDDELLEERPEGLEPDGTVLPMSLGTSRTSSGLSSTMLGGAGSPLPSDSQSYMSSRFGHDFSAVRIHTDARAHQATRSINAAAFTYGRDIYFGADRFQPSTIAGRRLLAHELTHVVQQHGGDQASDTIRRSPLQRPLISSLGNEPPTLRRTVEAHVNLRTPQRVRIYDSSKTGASDYVTSAGTGTRTSRYISRTPYPILDKRVPPTAKVGTWGLQYFAWFTSGGVGFHSEYCYPRSRGRSQLRLTVNGTPQSHGCMRLFHADSIRVYNALSVGDNVFIYNRRAWRPASWTASGGSTGTSPAPGGGSTTPIRTYTVQSGDTLSEIAAGYPGVSWQDIRDANGITGETSIRPGQVLTIPAP